jgi:RNA polymerase primary sigma factor
MGAKSLLTAEEEVELAQRMHRAKRRLASLARLTRGSDRPRVPDNPRDWPIEEIEPFMERLERDAVSSEGSRSLRRLVEAREHKRHLDAARGRLIEANLRLVVHLAKQYAGSHGVGLLDLIQEGNLGLMRAVEKFEYERGNKFSTYAFWWIKQSIDRAIADKSRVIRIPVHQCEKRKKVARTAAQLRRDLGREPEPREIAERLHLPLEKVEEVLDLVKEPRSLEDLGNDDTGQQLLDKVRNPAALDPDRQLESVEIRDRVGEALSARLNDREERIIRLRYGLGGGEPLTLQEVGRVVRLSRERVRQIEAFALKKLQSSAALASLLKVADPESLAH